MNTYSLQIFATFVTSLGCAYQIARWDIQGTPSTANRSPSAPVIPFRRSFRGHLACILWQVCQLFAEAHGIPDRREFYIFVVPRHSGGCPLYLNGAEKSGHPAHVATMMRTRGSWPPTSAIIQSRKQRELRTFLSQRLGWSRSPVPSAAPAPHVSRP